MVRFTGLLAMFPSPCGLPPSGPDFRYTNFSGGRGFAFYLHTLFGMPSPSHFTYTNFSGCRHHRILLTQTFRVAFAVAFAFYLHIFFGRPGFAFYLHTLSGRFLNQIEKNDFKFEAFSALRAPFFLSNP